MSIDLTNIGSYSVEELKSRKKDLEKRDGLLAFHHVRDLHPEYSDQFSVKNRILPITSVALVVIGLVAFILFATNGYAHILKSIQTINPLHAALAGGIVLILVAGASYIIHRARTQFDETLKGDRGTFGDMSTALESVRLIYKGSDGHIEVSDGYLDHSTMDSQGRKIAYIFGHKEVSDHYTVSSIVSFLGTPFYTIAVIVYNLLRTVVIPFYILYKVIQQQFSDDELLPADQRFTLSDIPKEMGLSIMRAVTAPFYGLAYFMAGFYSLFNPMGGRKLAAYIEFMWNEGIPLPFGFWSVQGWQALSPHAIEGGGKAGELGKNGFYFAGCWQAIAIMVDGRVYKMKHYLEDKLDNPLIIVSRKTQFEDKDNLAKLEKEYVAIRSELTKRVRV